MQTKRRINVFLASPSDVSIERTIAEEVVTAVNRSIRDYLEWYFDLHKWEDTTPGFGRPQGLLNQVVDECDLFIGLLWERWGQPTGKYSSGFEEEYHRVTARRKTHDHPEIWLVFKDVDSNKLRDPGDQLKQVIKFRESQVALGEVLFKSVRDSEDWRVKLQTWLVEYVLKLDTDLRRAQQNPNGVVPGFEAPDTAAIESAQSRGHLGIPKQLQTLSASLNQVLLEGKLEFSSTSDNPLQEFDVVRLFLLSGTLISHRHTSELFGTHEMNLFFKHRKRLKPMGPEEFQLLRAVISNETDVVPGWFWFKTMDEDAVQNALLELATRDSADSVRKRALDLLTSAKIKIPQELWSDLPLNHDSWQVRKAALAYLVAQEDESALTFLEKLATYEDSAPAVEIREARFQLLTRLHPGKAFSEAIARDEYLSDDELRALTDVASALDVQTLLTGIESSWERIRKLSLEELIRRGKLSVELAQRFTTDSSLEIRALAFQSLAVQGALPDFETVRKALTDEKTAADKGIFAGLGGLLGGRKRKPSPDSDSIIVSFYGTQTAAQLAEAVDWYSMDGERAYRALALHHFDKISTQLRADMADRFERVKRESSEREEKIYGTERWKKHAAKMEELDDFIRSRFIEAALITLTINGEPADVEIARPFLTQADSRLRDPAVKIISKFGNSQDAEILLKIAEEAYGDIKQEAAAAALRLSASPLQVARELMRSTSAEVVRIAFSYLFNENSDEVKLIFQELFNSTTDSDRVRALYYLHKTSPSAALEDLLDTYTAREIYYYNIVAWLDRLLYAPLPLREMFIRQLQNDVG